MAQGQGDGRRLSRVGARHLADRHAVLIGIQRQADVDRLLPVVEQSDGQDGFSVVMTGEGTLDHDFNDLSQHDLKSGELEFGLPAALIVLLVVFGAVVAGLIPLLMAIIAIVVALGLCGPIAAEFSLSVFVVNMLTGMGLALGIDYSLFVLSRYREERAAGRAQHDAIAAAGATSSRAVLFSGTVFVIALSGMLLVPSNVMKSLAVGAITVAIVSVVAALTLLPALLGLLGDRINALRLPWSAATRAGRGASGAPSCGRHAAAGRQPRRPSAPAARAGGARPSGCKLGRQRRQHAAEPARVEAGLRRARARLPAGELEPGPDRGRRRVRSPRRARGDRAAAARARAGPGLRRRQRPAGRARRPRGRDRGASSRATRRARGRSTPSGACARP